jgi:hypothetical protein
MSLPGVFPIIDTWSDMRLLLAIAVGLQLAASSDSVAIAGLVHEAPPTEATLLGGVRIEASGGDLDGQVFTTEADGRFALPRARAARFVLQFTKPGYEPARIDIQPPAAQPLRVPMMPERGEVVVSKSGSNACTDLPPPPDTVPGLREYARIAVHHDGNLVVRAAQLPFMGNQGYVYRQTNEGWEKNEIDYVLLRTPVPVLGGFVYSLTFGGGQELCRAWSLDATHPR